MILEDVLTASGNPNMYNTGTFNLPNDGTTVNFLNDPHIQEMLHVRGSDIPGMRMQMAEDDIIHHILRSVFEFVSLMNLEPEHQLTIIVIDDNTFCCPGINFEPDSKNANIVDGVFSPKKWEMCNFNISESMAHDHPISSVPAIANIMQHIRVLMYNGAMDLSCNHLGATHTLEMTNWNGHEWSDAERSLMKHKGDVFGQYYELRNLSFLVVRAAGHFVPTDQPSGALDMISRFLHRQSFADVVLPKDKSYTNIPLKPAGLDVLATETIYVNSTLSSWRPTIVGICALCVLVITYNSIRWRKIRNQTFQVSD